MANEIIRVYDTEINALAGTSTGQLGFDTIDGNGSCVSNNTDLIPYYIYTKYFYRIESNEPVTEFHIDWDDGEDNSFKKANIQIIKLDVPSFFTVTSHIYTDCNRYFPLIRVKNIEGFLSKWYTNDSSDNIFTQLESYAISGGQNEFSQVSREKAGSDRIPHFIPSQLPPVAVLKVDKTTIHSGINNRPITAGPVAGGGTTIMDYPLLYVYSTMLPITSTLTFSAGDVPEATDTLTIVSADGTSRVYTAGTAGEEDASALIWHASNTAATQVDSLNNAIAHANGHAAKFTVSQPTGESGLVLRLDDKTTGTSASITKTGATNAQIAIVESTSTANSPIQPTVKLTLQQGDGRPADYETQAVNDMGRKAIKEFTVTDTEIVTADADLDTHIGSTSELATKAIPYGNYNDTGSGSSAYETYSLTFVSTNATPPGLAGQGQKEDYLGDYMIWYSGGLPYLLWFDISGSDAQPGVIVPPGFGEFAGILTIDFSDSDDDINSEFAARLRTTLLASSQFTAAFAIDNITDNILTLSSRTAGNEPDWSVSDTTHLTLDKAQDGSNILVTTGKAYKLLRAELVNVDKLGDDDRIYVKVVDANYSGGLNCDISYGRNDTICILSNGNPIVDLTDKNSVCTVDGSGSRVRSSNVSVTGFYLDNDEAYSGSNGEVQGVSSPSNKMSNISEYFYGQMRMMPVDSSSTELSYTNHNRHHLMDEDKRFLPFYRLLRLQVFDDTTTFDLDDDGILTSRSFIEGWRHDDFTSTVDGGTLRIPTSLASNSCLLYSNHDTTGVAAWHNIGDAQLDPGEETSDSHLNTDVNNAIMGGDDASPELNLRYDTSEDGNTGRAPKNWLLMAKTDKFNQIYFNLKTHYASGVGGTLGNSEGLNIEITAYYNTAIGSAQVADYGRGGWEPLETIDGTQGFKTSGYIKWVPPIDWGKTTAADIRGIDWSLWPIPGHEGATSSQTYLNSPVSVWDFDGYAILLGIKIIADTTGYDWTSSDTTTALEKFRVMSVYPCNNSHSQLIKVIDPHHASLNNIAIVQSISYTRGTKFVDIKDRLGKSQIRKLGVNGGAVSFGSVDLGDTDAQGNRKKIKRYQQDATPVYLDVTHRSGERTRFYGVITNMSEDFPVGTQFPKYAIQMQVSYLIELDSTGGLISDKISIGGNIDEVGKHISSA